METTAERPTITVCSVCLTPRSQGCDHHYYWREMTRRDLRMARRREANSIDAMRLTDREIDIIAAALRITVGLAPNPPVGWEVTETWPGRQHRSVWWTNSYGEGVFSLNADGGINQHTGTGQYSLPRNETAARRRVIREMLGRFRVGPDWIVDTLEAVAAHPGDWDAARTEIDRRARARAAIMAEIDAAAEQIHREMHPYDES